MGDLNEWLGQWLWSIADVAPGWVVSSAYYGALLAAVACGENVAVPDPLGNWYHVTPEWFWQTVTQTHVIGGLLRDIARVANGEPP